jgi:hypothetical protein
MADKIEGVDPNRNNPINPQHDQAPVDPSNTSSVGQKVEQGVISTHRGISEQSTEWEDMHERNIPANPEGVGKQAENYIKDPSPEEMNSAEKEQ